MGKSPDKDEHFKKLLLAIEAERKDEEKYYNALRSEDSRQSKINSGIVLFPLILNSSNFTIGERIELVFHRRKNLNQEHKFKTGVACSLSLEGRSEITYKASVSYVRKNEFKIILSNHELSLNEFPKSGWYCLELDYDEKPFKVMREAIWSLLRSKDLAHIELKEGLINNSDFHHHFQDIEEWVDPFLNNSQNEAINKSLQAERIAIIHGPPGTGKTTTIISLVQALLKSEKRILLCAPSNNAVDLLAKRADEKGIKSVRIGNVTRINDHISHLTLDEKMRNDPDWSHIKKIKIEAEEAKKVASSYKRKFGNDERAYRSMMYKESRELRNWARELESRLQDRILSDAEIICSTLVGVSSRAMEDLNFNTVIIDEASQALEPECWNAILKAKKVILVGDHMQLPPTVKSKEATKLGLTITLLDRFYDNLKYSSLLTVQYRMNEAILGFSNTHFYEGMLKSDDKNTGWTLRNDSEPLTMIDTSGCGFEEIFNYKTKSIYNPEEFYILREYLTEQREKLLGTSIGIISPYAEQARFIRDNLSEDDEFKPLDLQVDTIDGFQGQEKEVIIISFVRSNNSSSIGFLKDFRRLNVAMTRAQKKLVLIGDFTCLAKEELYNKLFMYVEKHGVYRSAWEFMKY